MKNIRVLAILIIVVAVAALVQRNYSKNIQKEKETLEKRISPTVTPKSALTPTPFPTSIPTFAPTAEPTSGSVDTTINNFVYPNSVKTSIGMNNVVMKSSDNPQVITDWYKERIKSLGMNVNSFVQTNTNGNVLNKLVSANSRFKISVNIVRKNNEGNTEIEVSLQ
ncbi:MAG: hypothetical protein HYT08_01095 [Candidatus Levybacteria bacterium]|nr:hypothetical protein [Candidatus Levybacteria bacterium]